MKKKFSKKHLQLILPILIVAILSFLMLWACAAPNSNSKGSDSGEKSDASDLENITSINDMNLASKSDMIHMDVFARFGAYIISHIWTFDGQNWSQWVNLPTTGSGKPISAPGAVSWGYGREDVFVASDNGKIYHNFFELNYRDWGKWDEFSGPPNATINKYCTPSASAIKKDGTIRMNVFIVGTKNNKKYVFHGTYKKGDNDITWDSNPLSGEVGYSNVVAGGMFKLYGYYMTPLAARSKNSYWLSNRWIDDDNPHDIGWFEDKAYYLSDTPEITPDNPYQVFALCSTNSDPIKKLRWINECKIVPDGAGTFVRPGVVCPAPEQYDFYVFENYPWADYIIYNKYKYKDGKWEGWRSLPSIAVDWDFAVDVVSWTCNNNP